MSSPATLKPAAAAPQVTAASAPIAKAPAASTVKAPATTVENAATVATNTLPTQATFSHTIDWTQTLKNIKAPKPLTDQELDARVNKLAANNESLNESKKTLADLNAKLHEQRIRAEKLKADALNHFSGTEKKQPASLDKFAQEAKELQKIQEGLLKEWNKARGDVEQTLKSLAEIANSTNGIIEDNLATESFLPWLQNASLVGAQLDEATNIVDDLLKTLEEAAKGKYKTLTSTEDQLKALQKALDTKTTIIDEELMIKLMKNWNEIADRKQDAEKKLVDEEQNKLTCTNPDVFVDNKKRLESIISEDQVKTAKGWRETTTKTWNSFINNIERIQFHIEALTTAIHLVGPLLFLSQYLSNISTLGKTLQDESLAASKNKAFDKKAHDARLQTFEDQLKIYLALKQNIIAQCDARIAYNIQQEKAEKAKAALEMARSEYLINTYCSETEVDNSWVTAHKVRIDRLTAINEELKNAKEALAEAEKKVGNQLDVLVDQSEHNGEVQKYTYLGLGSEAKAVAKKYQNMCKDPATVKDLDKVDPYTVPELAPFKSYVAPKPAAPTSPAENPATPDAKAAAAKAPASPVPGKKAAATTADAPVETTPAATGTPAAASAANAKPAAAAPAPIDAKAAATNVVPPAPASPEPTKATSSSDEAIPATGTV